MEDKKRRAAAIAVSIYFQPVFVVGKLMWSDYRSVGWMNKVRNR